MHVEPEGLMEIILVKYRWIFVVFFLMPASFFYSMVLYARNKLIFWLNSAPKTHDRKVRKVQKQVQTWISQGKKQLMCTGRPGWQTMSFRQPLYKKTHFNVHIDLVDVLEIDKTQMTVRVEPMVTMGQLSATLLTQNLTLPIMPELDDLTVGGLVMGTGVESSSHIYGLFQHICLQFELVLADGSIVTCSKDENPDLFYSVPWSHGTLGFLTAVVIKVIPSKKYVKLTYQHIRDEKEIARAFNWEANKPNPPKFLEGIVFSRSHAVIMTGEFVDFPSGDGYVNDISAWYKPWFFKHVQNIKNGAHEYIPLRAYYHRHTKSIFWELQDIIPFGNNILFRLVFGWLMPPKISLLKIAQPDAVKRLYEKAHVIQDMLVPIEALDDSLNEFHKQFEIYPMWLCAFKLPQLPGMLQIKNNNQTRQNMFVDIGVYGVPKAEDYETVKSTRKIEKFVLEHHGFQMLYADTYTTREEFHSMFSHELYDKVRDKYNCRKAFPEVYDKVCRKARS